MSPRETKGHRGSGPSALGRGWVGVGTVLLLACTPPQLRQATALELQSGPCAGLVDGSTTREEVLWRFGTPSAHVQGEQILTYAFRWHPVGGWRKAFRRWTGHGAAPAYGGQPGLHNLVLVFGPEGRLVRHSVVVAE